MTENNDLHFRANLTRVNEHWYINNVFIYAVGERFDTVNTVEVSGNVYLFIIRQFGNQQVNSARKLKFYIDDGVEPVETVDQIREKLVGASLNGVEDFELDELQHKLKFNVRHAISQNTQLLSFTLFNYMKLNNELIAAGFCITDDNREEVYLKIINTGDIELIDKLSSYLDAYDELSAGSKYVNRYNDAVRIINNAKTVDELNREYVDKIAPTLCEVN